jgi:hypothetical protein
LAERSRRHTRPVGRGAGTARLRGTLAHRRTCIAGRQEQVMV